MAITGQGSLASGTLAPLQASHRPIVRQYHVVSFLRHSMGVVSMQCNAMRAISQASLTTWLLVGCCDTTQEASTSGTGCLTRMTWGALTTQAGTSRWRRSAPPTLLKAMTLVWQRRTCRGLLTPTLDGCATRLPCRCKGPRSVRHALLSSCSSSVCVALVHAQVPLQGPQLHRANFCLLQR